MHPLLEHMGTAQLWPQLPLGYAGLLRSHTDPPEGPGDSRGDNLTTQVKPDVAKASSLWSNAAPGPWPGNPERRHGGLFPRPREGIEEEVGHGEVSVSAKQHGSQGSRWAGAGQGLSAALTVENKTLNAF